MFLQYQCPTVSKQRVILVIIVKLADQWHLWYVRLLHDVFTVEAKQKIVRKNKIVQLQITDDEKKIRISTG
jgi:hypothetical protein